MGNGGGGAMIRIVGPINGGNGFDAGIQEKPVSRMNGRSVMNKHGLAVCALGVGLLWGGAGAAADTIESVEKAIVENSKKVKSFTAKIHTTADMDMGGMKSKTVSDGKFEMLRKGDKTLTRMESKDSTTFEMGGKPQKHESTTLVISDGEFAYVLNEVSGQKTAMKMKSQVDWVGNPFEEFRKTHELKLLPDEKVDDQAVWVVEATPKTSAGPEVKGAGPEAMGKMTQYYLKDCGVPVKMVTFGPAGKPMSTTTYSDLKLDVSLSADRFVFKAPAGVTIQDMTKLMPPGGTGEDAKPQNDENIPKEDDQKGKPKKP